MGAPAVRAVVMRKFGAPQVLEPGEVPELSAAAGQVVVDVEFANVTFVETQVRAGKPPHPAMLPALPAILGNGVGGTVAEVGTGVHRGLTGRRVVASLAGTGGYAERAVADAHQLVEVPDRVELRDAVALLADGRTALALTALAQIRKG
jgi:NADPH:quinone reductase